MNYSNDLFEINPEAEIAVEYIGHSRSLLVTIDNVLKDPGAASEFLQQIPQQDAVRHDGRRPPGFFPGFQTYISYDFFPLNQFINQQLNMHFGSNLNRPSWSYQTCDSVRPVYTQSRFPHSDQGQIAANIFLNADNELGSGSSGTGFYRYRETGEESPFHSNCRYRKQRYGYASPNMELAPLSPIKDDENWQQYHVAEQRWNRMNIYEGALFHCVYFDSGMFSQNSRITLSMIDN